MGTQNLQKLAKEKLVDGFDYNSAKETVFCESCAEEKHHQSQFSLNGGKWSDELLGLVHSDVCRKISTQSLSGA